MTFRQWYYRNVYLKSPAWKITRWLRKRDYCYNCGSKKLLHLHHVNYDGYIWWNLLIPDLLSKMETLCSRCHRQEHNRSTFEK